MFICNIIKKKLSPSCSRLTWGFMTLDLETCLNETVWFGSFSLNPPPPLVFSLQPCPLSTHTLIHAETHTHTHTQTDTHTDTPRGWGKQESLRLISWTFWEIRLLAFSSGIQWEDWEKWLAWLSIKTAKLSHVWMVTLTLVRWCGIKNDQVHLGNGSYMGLWPNILWFLPRLNLIVTVNSWLLKVSFKNVFWKLFGSI